MTTKELIQHPTTGNLKLLTVGFAVGLFFQHSVDLKEQAAWLSQFLGSEEFKAGLVGVLGVVMSLQQALPKDAPLAALADAGQLISATLGAKPGASPLPLAPNGAAAPALSVTAQMNALARFVQEEMQKDQPAAAAPK